jgi:hypothetical protein
VQAIANAHAATITARAQTGGGLRIAVNFPAAASPKPPVAQDKSPKARRSHAERDAPLTRCEVLRTGSLRIVADAIARREAAGLRMQ